MAKDIIGTDLIPTPNPKEFALEVTAKNSVLWSIDTLVQAEGVAYRNFPEGFIEMSKLENYGDYIYDKAVAAEKGHVRLLFFKPKTEAEKKIPFKTIVDYKPVEWDDILLALFFFKNPVGRSSTYIGAAARGVVTQNTYRVKEAYIPGGMIPSIVTTEEFFAATKFDIPSYEYPIPTPVTWDVPGTSGRYPRALHPKITIPNLQAGVVTFVAGSVSDVGGIVGGQVFNETNVVDWDEKVLNDSQDSSMGYYRKRVTARPLEQPEIDIR